MSQREDVVAPIASVPMELRVDIQNQILNHAVALFGAADAFERGKDDFIGSGTLVAVNDKPFVLTAAHVWSQIKSFGTMSILLDAEGKAFSTPTEAVGPLVPEARRCDAWGPDIAYLALPAEVFALAKDHKVFLNLSRRIDESLQTQADATRGLWAVAGAPAEWIKPGTAYSMLSFNTFFSGIDATWSRDRYDYLDLGFNHAGRPDLPSTYRGLSGAGLWQIPLAVSQTSGQVVWDGSVLLEGVAFYEEFGPAGGGFIRCHGRHSIYQIARRLSSG